MSVSALTTVWCDGPDCLEWASTPADTAREARRLARREGWKVGLLGGRDLCPDCLREAAARKTTR